MNGFALRAMVMHEVRLRMRRTSTIIALLAVVAVTWLTIPDPGTGMTLMTADNSRMLYDSMTLSLGSASLINLVFGLGGFYLVRGRIAEDLRHGLGAAIGATRAGNTAMLVGRWFGAMAYLGMLALAFAATTMVLHQLRGEAPIEPFVYLQSYVLLLLPVISATAAMAVLFEACSPLIGKRGDVLYFIYWAAQLGAVTPNATSHLDGWSPLFVIDFTGMRIVFARLIEIFHSPYISIGVSDFNAHLAPVVIGNDFWTMEMAATRLIAALLGAAPLLAAVLLFHRFSPDSVKAAHASKRRSPLEILNRWLRPLARFATPLFAVATRLPGAARGIVADLALTLTTKPSTIAATIAAFVAGSLAQASALGGIATATVTFWGIAISDVAVRDYATDAETMSGAFDGGASARYLRQMTSTMLLACIMTAPIMLRWLAIAPMKAFALAAGLILLCGTAQMLGRATRTARTFLALFMLAMYISVQAPRAAFLDITGAHGSATALSMAVLVLIGAMAATLGYLIDRRASR